MARPILALALLAAACAPARPVAQVSAMPAEAEEMGVGRLPDELCVRPPEVAPRPLPPGVQAAPAVPPMPIPPPPPSESAFLATPEPVLTGTGDPRLDSYLKRVLFEGGPGWRPFLLRAFAPIRSRPDVLRAHAALQAPGDAREHVRRFVTPERIAQGRRLYRELQGKTLFQGERRVPLEVLLALWGAMSDYGRSRPPVDMVETLAHLGACGRGPGWQSFDIYEAVRILAESRLPRGVLKAYPEGRIGQVRWLTDQYLQWRVDGNGDGVVDVWTDPADILANFNLRGWEGSAPILVEVERPSFDRRDPAQRRMAEAVERGGRNVPATLLKRADGQPWSDEARNWGGSYVEPFGPGGPAFFLTRNHTPVNYMNPFKPRYWDDHGDPGFGIAVGLLAEAIAGGPGPSRPI